MKNGIKMSDCKFYVDEEARTVVCVIPDTKDMVLDFLTDHARFSDFDLDFGTEWKLKNELLMPNSFMGKAVCSEEDEWDEDTGRLIAYSRARNKCYTSFFKRANAYVQALDRRLGDIITMFNDFGMRLEDKRVALETKIEELTQVDEEE